MSHEFVCGAISGATCVYRYCRCRICAVMNQMHPTVEEVPVTEYRKGDKIRVTDVRESVVVGVDNAGYVYVDDQEYLNPKCAHKLKWTRTIEIVERAAAPWQAGDILNISGAPIVRQADGSWMNRYGDALGLQDEHIENNGEIKVVVRGGKRA